MTIAIIFFTLTNFFMGVIATLAIVAHECGMIEENSAIICVGITLVAFVTLACSGAMLTLICDSSRKERDRLSASWLSTLEKNRELQQELEKMRIEGNKQMMSKEKQIEEMAEVLRHSCENECFKNKDGFTDCEACEACLLHDAGYRKQSEGEINYKALYEQLLEDFEHALHYAEKNNNVCNFCEHDCGEGGICKGRDNFIYCTPKWRGVKKIIPDCEAPKGSESNV